MFLIPENSTTNPEPLDLPPPPGAGADIQARNLKASCPIHSAANAGQLEAALRLVVAGANWRPGRSSGGSDADVIRALVRKGGYKVSSWIMKRA
jgi:hypothetical protein